MVSVIIPCYNAESTISATLDSLREQTFKEFEAIIINDGSNDNSETVIDEYKKNHPYMTLKYYAQENKGVSAARNYGIKKSRREYITFLDADDAYAEDYLQILMEAIKGGIYDIAICKYKYVRDQAEIISRYDDFKKESIDRYGLLEKYIHKRKTKFNFWGAIYKRKLILEHNIEFPVGIKYGEDSVFVCSYLYHCDTGIFIDKPMYKYLVTNSSAMHRNSYGKVQNIEAYKMIVNYWKKDECFNKELGDYLIARAIWATAKEFCIGDCANFDRLISEYDVKNAMITMLMQGDELLIRISAALYLINPMVFRRLLETVIRGN